MEDPQKAPRVSVRLPSYNHEKYIRECVESVLAQTFADFEFVITDDGSTDRTARIIKEYKDPRIRLAVLEKNRGSALAIRDALSRAGGEYVANICSDDAWEQDKLKKQVDFLDSHPEYDAVFTGVRLVGENGKPVGRHPLEDVFTVENHSRDEWLRRFFYSGNCLCIPSVLIRREVYRALAYQDKRMASLLDFDLWVRFSLEHSFYILEDRLTRFRVRSDEANASGNRMENHIQSKFEYKQILRHFLKINSAERLKSVFPQCVQYGRPEDRLVPYFLGRLAYDTGEDFKQLWGLEAIFDFMRDDGRAKELEQALGFTCLDFYGMSKTADVFKVREGVELRLSKEEINKLRRVADVRQQQLEEMQHSNSWKLTAPLRKASDLTGKKNNTRKDKTND